MRTRDKRDAEREASPLVPAPDAIVLDTTGLSLTEVVEHVLSLASQAQDRGARSLQPGPEAG